MGTKTRRRPLSTIKLKKILTEIIPIVSDDAREQMRTILSFGMRCPILVILRKTITIVQNMSFYTFRIRMCPRKCHGGEKVPAARFAHKSQEDSHGNFFHFISSADRVDQYCCERRLIHPGHFSLFLRTFLREARFVQNDAKPNRFRNALKHVT